MRSHAEMQLHGSPFWQAAIFGFAALFLLWELWWGWRRGVIRSAVHFFAFVFSGMIGFLAGQVVASVVGRFLPGYGIIAGLLVGSVLTLVILALALILGALLFKRTSQQPSNTIRLLYGGGGAFFGLLTGLFILWGGITIIRSVGTVAETAIKSRPNTTPPAISSALVKLKESLELGPAGKAVEAVDVVPAETYDLIVRVGQLSSNQEAIMRLVDYPGMQAVLQSPKIAALVNDPAIAEAAQQMNFVALMQNPKLLQAATDPEVSKIVMAFDVQKALDYALPPAQTSPTPQPKP